MRNQPRQTIEKKIINKKNGITVAYLALAFLLGIALVKGLVAWKPKLGFIEFGLLFTFAGLYPAFLFRKVFNYKDVIGFLTNSSVISLIMVPLLIQFFGFLGINFVFVCTIQLLYAISGLGLIALAFHSLIIKEDLFSKFNLQFVDFIILFTIFIATCVFTFRTLSSFRPAWDTFTFWGLDSNYLFNENRLRDANFTVAGNFQYTSFYPIYYSIMYDLYGGVFEQFATWVNVYITAISMLLVYTQFNKEDTANKLSMLPVLLLTAVGASNVVFMFAIYADILLTFIVLVYAVILFNDEKLSPSNYPIRCLLILSTLFALFFIKDGLYLLSIILAMVYVIYDFNFIKDNFRKIIKNPKIYFVLMFFVAFVIMYINYFDFIQFIPGTSRVFEASKYKKTNLGNRLNYIVEVFKYLIDKSLILTTVGISYILFSLFIILKKRANKKFIFLFIIFILLSGFFLGGYIISLRDLTSGSLLRYIAIAMYLPALSFSLYDIKYKYATPMLATIALFIAFAFLGRNLYRYVQQADLGISGNYCHSNQLGPQCILAEKIIDIIGEDGQVLILESSGSEHFSNSSSVQSIFLRYYLQANSVGGQFNWLYRPVYLDYAKEHGADWIYFFNSDFLNGCGISNSNGFIMEMPNRIVENPLDCEFLIENLVGVE